MASWIWTVLGMVLPRLFFTWLQANLPNETNATKPFTTPMPILHLQHRQQQSLWGTIQMTDESKIVLHILGCSCDKCTFKTWKCPICGWDAVHGMYSCVPPYKWFWEVGNCDEPSDCIYCANCGIRLPDYGTHPAAPIIDK